MHRPARQSFDNVEESLSRIHIVGIDAGPFSFYDANAQSHGHRSIGIGEASAPPLWQGMTEPQVNPSSLCDQGKGPIDGFRTHRIEMDVCVQTLRFLEHFSYKFHVELKCWSFYGKIAIGCGCRHS